ncbi:MAG: efflux RND transporter periplasmic adaptor subunit [Acetobacteraceae bacterium]
MIPFRVAGLVAAALLIIPAASAPAATPAPAVGVVSAKIEPIYESNQYVGKIQAERRVHLVARVSGFLEQRLFEEGSDVKKGQLLYVIEQPPYQAAVSTEAAAVAQAEAELTNANLTLQRQAALLHTPAGQQSIYDTAVAAKLSNAAQVASAKAQLETASINLGYTDIQAPISGRIGITNISVGNFVAPSSGTLATITSEDPMYVMFEIPSVDALKLNDKYRAAGGLAALSVRIVLPDGETYKQSGKVNFMSNTVSPNTDTILLRATIPNPALPGPVRNGVANRELTDGEFVTVILRALKPEQSVVVPREAVVQGPLGSHVFVVNDKSVLEQRAVTLGQTTPTTAVIKSGVKAGDRVVVAGVQRAQPGLKVKAEAISNSTSAGGSGS